MTVINGIEIDAIEYDTNLTKQALANNEPIDDTLHVVAVVSNPAMFARRFILTKQFLRRMEQESNVVVYVVELAYGSQNFYITDAKNPRHLQLRTEVALWHKENMINVGIRRLLPPKWKAVAWIDADVEFESGTWALDTLKVLNGYKDVVQVFSHCIDMEKDESAMRIFSGFGFQYDKKQTYSKDKTNYWHPGYAWAMTRKAYDRIGGLYEYGILGSGDNIMSLSILEQGLKGIHVDSTDEYKESIVSFQTKMKTLRLGYVPGVIRHHYHGRKQDRKYTERWRILTDSFYNPREHLTKDAAGLIVPTASCPKGMITQIKEYFYARNEDDLTIFMDK
jgi:hypothetical protein